MVEFLTNCSQQSYFYWQSVNPVVNNQVNTKPSTRPEYYWFARASNVLLLLGIFLSGCRNQQIDMQDTKSLNYVLVGSVEADETIRVPADVGRRIYELLDEKVLRGDGSQPGMTNWIPPMVYKVIFVFENGAKLVRELDYDCTLLAHVANGTLYHFPNAKDSTELSLYMRKYVPLGVQ